MTTRGHLSDANTIGLWRLDEPRTTDQANDELGLNALPLVSGPVSVVPGLINDGGRARRFIWQAAYRGVTSTALNSVFSGEVTFEAWVSLSPSWNRLGIVGGYTNTGLPGLEVEIQSDRNFRVVWGKAGAVQETFTTAVVGGVVPLNARTHIAVRRKLDGGGLTTQMEAFVNGVSVGLTTGLGNPVATTGNVLAIGSTSSLFWFEGTVDDVRLSKIARTNAEILTSYQRGITDFVAPVSISGLGHKLDQSTLALWRLDEATSTVAAADATGVHNLPVAGGTPIPVPGLVPDSGLAKLFPGVVSSSYIGVGSTVMGTALLGEWTIEAWIRADSRDPNAINDTRIIDIQDATKRYAWLSVNLLGRLQVFWQNAGNVQYDDTTTTLAIGTIYHVAAKKVSLGGGNYRVDIFVNGIKVSSSGSLANTTAAGAPTSVALGSGIGGAPFYGVIDDVRLSSIARADIDIFESYRRGSSSQIRGITAQGHLTDLQTFGMWRLDEPSGAPAVDSMHLIPDLPVVGTPPPAVSGIIQDGGTARNCNAVGGFNNGAIPQPSILSLVNEVTVETWAYFTSFAAGTTIFGIRDSATNQLIRVGIDSNGTMFMGYWTGASTITLISSVVASRLNLNQRYHLAWRRRLDPANAGKYLVEFLINGVETAENLNNNLGAGTPVAGNASISIGNLAGTGFATGILDDMRVTIGARSDFEILNSYWRGILDKSDLQDFNTGALKDANTVYLWRLNESTGDSPARDEVSGNDLAQIGLPSVVTGRVGGAREVGPGIILTKNFGSGAIEPSQAIIKSGNFTIESWIYIDPTVAYPATWPGPGNNHGIVVGYSGVGAGGAGALVGLDSTGFFHYNGTSGFVNVGSWQNLTKGAWHHFAVRCTSLNATQMNVDFFVDGQFIGTGVSLKWTGTPVAASWQIGGENSAFNAFDGFIDDVRVSNIPRTNDEIFQSFHKPEIVYDLQSLAALRGTDRLLQQYKDATSVGVREVVAEGSNEVQDVNNALASFDSQLNVATATGKPLELLGKLVGEYRQGRSDDVYRIWVSAKIRINRSNGTIEDIIDIFRILTSSLATVVITEYQPASITVKISGFNVSSPNDFLAVLRLARKAGVGYRLEYSTGAYGFGFRFAGGVVGGGRGFPDAVLTPGSGGKLAGVK